MVHVFKSRMKALPAWCPDWTPSITGSCTRWLRCRLPPPRPEHHQRSNYDVDFRDLAVSVFHLQPARCMTRCGRRERRATSTSPITASRRRRRPPLFLRRGLNGNRNQTKLHHTETDQGRGASPSRPRSARATNCTPCCRRSTAEIKRLDRYDPDRRRDGPGAVVDRRHQGRGRGNAAEADP